MDVVLESCYYCAVCVELESLWRERTFGSRNVISCPAKECKFPTVVVVLNVLASRKALRLESYIVICEGCHDPQAVLPGLEDSPVHRSKGLLVHHSLSRHHTQGIANTDA